MWNESFKTLLAVSLRAWREAIQEKIQQKSVDALPTPQKFFGFINDHKEKT